MTPAEVEARILLEEDGVLAMNKPPDLPSTGRQLDDDDCLQYWLIERHGGMVWGVHQLDADTSGVNLFVTEKPLVARFKTQMESPTAYKRYLAIVNGSPLWEERSVEAPIGKVDERNFGVHWSGRAAHSHFKVLSRGPRAALVEARIYTGRTYQIRIHLSHIEHPLLGEKWFVPAPCERHHRQALHAHRLQLDELDVRAPLPQDLLELMAREQIAPRVEER